ncbi:MAG: exodeoxyribonuclease V subunit beta [Thiotrichaceae bacterium]|nr:exodeoxyribonuclease V subunit beta [Thiotrichaceae bacterium]
MKTQEFDLFNSALTGINLIAASAGTGKTYTIAHVFTRLVVEKKIPVNKILVVTFTDAATKELRDRIRARLRETLTAMQRNASDDSNIAKFNERYPQNSTEKEEAMKRLDDALRGFDEAGIFTIHSFCRQMLQDHAFESGILFDTQLEKNIAPLLRECVEDFWRQQLYRASPLLIQYVQQAYKNPLELVKNFLQNERLLTQPDLVITPKFELCDTQTDENAYLQAFHATQKLWATARPEVEDLLNTQDSLNGNSYRKTSFPNWFNELSIYFSNQPSLTIPDALPKFTHTALQNKVKKGKNPPEHLFFESCEFLFNSHTKLNIVFEQQLLALKYALLKQAKKELQAKKQQLNIQSFDDLLNNLYKALQSDKGESLGQLMRDKYYAVLIDEFQDTDPVQYEIFHRVYSNCDNPILFFIGDPKQAIYSFRGADIFAYLNACNTAENHYTLSVNRRSEVGLIDAVNQLFSAHPNPFIFTQIPFNPAQAPKDEKNNLTFAGESREPLVFWELSETTRVKDELQSTIAQAVAAEIVSLLNPDRKVYLGEKALTGGDIAILVRTNQQARMMQKTLGKYRIPCVLYSQESLFASHELMEIERILLAIAFPQQEAHVRAALATELLGVTAETLHSLMHNEAQWQQRIKSFQDYHSAWETQGFIQMFRKLLLQEQITKRLLAYPDGERRLTNVLHAGEVLQQTAVTEKFSMSALCNWLATQRNEAEASSDEHQLRLESDEKLVKIVTIHKSKGLEYPIVFCPYSWEMNLPSLTHKNSSILFHDTANKNALTLNLAGDKIEHREDKAREELAESLRLFYVAVTRAKNRCYLVWGAFKEAENSPLGHLLHDSAIEGIARKLAGEKADKDDSSNLSSSLVHNKLVSLVENSQNTITLQILPEPSSYYRKLTEITPYLAARDFAGKIPQAWKISSFSALAHQASVEASELPDYDESPVLRPQPLPENLSVVPSIFSFHKGKRAGLFLHEVFEKIDFTSPDINKLPELLKKYNYPVEQWEMILWTWLQTMLNAPLAGQFGNLVLADLSRETRLNELVFFHPLRPINFQGLSKIFEEYHLSTSSLDLSLERLTFKPMQGFMTGIIDMVCYWEGRYYLIDYKSHYLGYRPEDYAPPHLAQVMKQERYVLQYHLYAVALHRYLSHRIPNYSYEQHFGGVYYLFLRGIQADSQESYGVFYDLPQPKLIQALSAYLGG